MPSQDYHHWILSWPSKFGPFLLIALTRSVSTDLYPRYEGTQVKWSSSLRIFQGTFMRTSHILLPSFTLVWSPTYYVAISSNDKAPRCTQICPVSTLTSSLNKGWPTIWHLLYYILLNMFQTLIRLKHVEQYIIKQVSTSWSTFIQISWWCTVQYA